MGSSFGGSIKLSGESEYTRAIKNISSQLKVLGSEMKLATSEFGANEKSSESLSKQCEVLSKTIAAQQAKITALKGEMGRWSEALKESEAAENKAIKARDAAAQRYEEQKKLVDQLRKSLEDSAKVLGEDTEETVALSKALADADSKLDIYGNDLKKATSKLANAEKATDTLQKKVNDYQSDINKANAEVNNMNRQLETNKKDMEAAEKATDSEKKAVKEMGDEADKSSNKFKALSGALKASAAAIAAIGGVSVAAGKKIWNMAKDVGAAGDEIDKNSQKIGISARSYQEWSYVFERSGADVSKLETGMKKLSGVIVDAGRGSDSAKNKLAAVGLTIDDLNNKSQDEQLSIVIDALQRMESGAERTAAANDLLGKSSTDMAAVLNMTAEETAALRKEAEDYGMVMSDKAVKSSAAFRDSLTKLKGAATGAKNALIGELLPGITTVSSGLADLVSGKAGGVESIREGMSSIIGSINDMIPKALELLSSIGEAIITDAPQILSTLADSILSSLPQIINTATTKVIPQLITVAIGATKQLIRSLNKELPTIMESLTQGAMDIITQFFGPENILDTIDLVIGSIESIVQGAQKALPIIISGAVDLALGLVQHADEIISALLDMIPVIISSIFDPNDGFLSSTNITKLVKGAVAIVGELVKRTPEIIASILAKIPEIIGDILDGFSGLAFNFLNIGKESGSSFLRGFAQTAGDILGFLGLAPNLSAAADPEKLGLLAHNVADKKQVIKPSQGQKKMFATGDIVTKPTEAIVGDDGAEAIIPLERHTEWINRVAEQMVSATANAARMVAATASYGATPAPAAAAPVEINIRFGDVNMASDMDVREVADQISDIIATDVIRQGRRFG